MPHTHHDHHHHKIHLDTRLNTAFWVGIAINLSFVIVEVLAGLFSGSLALLTDAGHNLSDVGSLGLSLLAFRLARIPGKGRLSYGYRKFTVLASLINALLLVVAVGVLGYEATRRLAAPPVVPGLTVAMVAAAGIVVNTLSAWLFYRDREKDLNVKGAYLHLAADAAVSAGVVVSGLAMYYFNWTWLDPVVSFAVLAIILWSTWGLLKESVLLSLDAVPDEIEIEKIRNTAMKIGGVKGIHHIHVWAMSTRENALTAHLVLEEGMPPGRSHDVKAAFRHELEHMNIGHATLETEGEQEVCGNPECQLS
ncbi:MAG: cation transporter [Saprospiraceae bacterium]|nr:cation transporter [Saprospiraceae bacterium]MCB0573456.1 cation transporter [Saprospiraceae bacterium]MCB9354452.1 cation transporter [Lewinellaceae bacterium]